MRISLNYIRIVLLLIFSGHLGAQEAVSEYDLVILGATPGGIMSAIEGARHGRHSIIIERSAHVGGLPANGLGATDLSTREAVGGLFGEFTRRVSRYYATTYGSASREFRECRGGLRFEPSVAERVFREMLDAEKGITILLEHQFDSAREEIKKTGDRITAIRVKNRVGGQSVWIRGKVFIDATYEGDLMAAAGVPFVVGREGKDVYDEALAGKVYKYWEGPVDKGSTGEGDEAIQAYNYRLCLTRDPKNMVAVRKPENYNREEYLSLVEDVLSGRHAGVEYQAWLKRTSKAERQQLYSRSYSIPPRVPGAPEGIERLFNTSGLPNGKYDANNQERALISSDLPEENWLWPEASWEWRDGFAIRLREYIQGLLWFAGNDEALPQWFRSGIRQWGYAADEYLDNGNFPRQVYVREGRRMKGSYFYTAHDALPVKEGERPPLHPSTVSAGHYSIDSHGVRKREEGRPHLDGFLSQHTMPFTIPYGVMVPEQIVNLLSPVAVSGSHLGFSVLRMEPTWMALGQVAGLAAARSITGNLPVQELDVKGLQKQLIEEDMVLLYYKDIYYSNRNFKAFQWMGIHGIFNDWEARPEKLVTEEEKHLISRVFGIPFDDLAQRELSRAMIANAIYQRMTGPVEQEGTH